MKRTFSVDHSWLTTSSCHAIECPVVFMPTSSSPRVPHSQWLSMARELEPGHFCLLWYFSMGSLCLGDPPLALTRFFQKCSVVWSSSYLHLLSSFSHFKERYHICISPKTLPIFSAPSFFKLHRHFSHNSLAYLISPWHLTSQSSQTNWHS